MVVHAQDMKVEAMIQPQTVTIASGVSTYGYLDTLGWDHCKLLYVSATEASSSAACITLKITEGTNSTAASAIVALTGGTNVVADSTGFTIPNYSTATDGGGAIVFDIDLTKRERYLRIHTVPSTPSNFVASALLSRGHAVPGSDDGSASGVHGIHVIA